MINRIKFRRKSCRLLFLLVLHLNVINDRKKEIISPRTAYETVSAIMGMDFIGSDLSGWASIVLECKKSYLLPMHWFYFTRKYCAHILHNVSCITHFSCWQQEKNVLKSERKKKFGSPDIAQVSLFLKSRQGTRCENRGLRDFSS